MKNQFKLQNENENSFIFSLGVKTCPFSKTVPIRFSSPRNVYTRERFKTKFSRERERGKERQKGKKREEVEFRTLISRATAP